MAASKTKHVRRSRKNYICDFCNEQIDAGTPYETWFTFGKNVTTRMHPECYVEMEEQYGTAAWEADTQR